MVTFDPSPEILPLFEDGVIQCIIAQDPYQMGYQGVGYIDKARKNVAIDKKKVELPPVVITPDNYQEPGSAEIAPDSRKILRPVSADQ